MPSSFFFVRLATGEDGLQENLFTGFKTRSNKYFVLPLPQGKSMLCFALHTYNRFDLSTYLGWGEQHHRANQRIICNYRISNN
jgi:hypothetical protein